MVGHKRYFKCSLITTDEVVVGSLLPLLPLEFRVEEEEKFGYFIIYSSRPGKSGSKDCTIRIMTTPGSVQGDKFNSTLVDSLKQ